MRAAGSHKPEDRTLRGHRRENLKCDLKQLTFAKTYFPLISYNTKSPVTYQNCAHTTRLSLLPSSYIFVPITHEGAYDSVVVAALCCKPEDCGFETWWGECLSIYQILPAAPGPKVYSASNRTEYQTQK
jgi:hypothetical protein